LRTLHVICHYSPLEQAMPGGVVEWHLAIPLRVTWRTCTCTCTWPDAQPCQNDIRKNISSPGNQLPKLLIVLYLPHRHLELMSQSTTGRPANMTSVSTPLYQNIVCASVVLERQDWYSDRQFQFQHVNQAGRTQRRLQTPSAPWLMVSETGRLS